jgi:ADA HAT complex component 1
VIEEVKMLGSNCAGINTLPLPQLKRKRSDSDASDALAATKVRADSPSARETQTESTEPVAQATASTPSSSDPPVASAHPSAQDAVVARSRPSIDRLRETITAQLSLEVLLKHNELRLIEQELAKCQVALEQLRRCAEIPYPGSCVTGISPEVSSGTGASLLPPGNGPAPVSPAPWGVTDGPYTRHYAQWLLPDPRFDGGEPERRVSTNAPEGRSTRGNPSDAGMVGGKSRPQRGSTAAKHMSLSSGHPPAKEKPGPMVMRRKSDNVLVKLVCLDCRRDNFSSTQGFINHCRIAHNRNFPSHDEAAIACGQAILVDAAGNVVAASVEPTPTPTIDGSVHPLNKPHVATTPWKRLRKLAKDAAIDTAIDTAKDTPKDVKDVNDTVNAVNHTAKETVTPDKPTVATSATAFAGPTPPATTQPSVRRHPAPHPPAPLSLPPNPQFLASPDTPHLSALMKSRGAYLDMEKLVQESRKSVDLSCFLSDDSESESSQRPSAETTFKGFGTRAGRQPMRMPVGQPAAESESRKDLGRADSPHTEEPTPSRPRPYLGLSLEGQSQSFESRDDGLEHQLSPHAQSNQAPSLVSDDEDDYEAASDSSSSEMDEEEQEFRHIQVEDDERSAAPSAAAEAKSSSSLTSPAPQSAQPLPQPLKRKRSKKVSSIADNDVKRAKPNPPKH